MAAVVVIVINQNININFVGSAICYRNSDSKGGCIQHCEPALRSALCDHVELDLSSIFLRICELCQLGIQKHRENALFHPLDM